MALSDQNISGEYLEKLRQNVIKKSKLQYVFPIITLIVLLLYSFIKNGIFFSYLSSEGFGNAATQGAFFSLIGGIIISVMIACTVFLIYHIMVWKKAYDLFDFTFKNKYVLHAVSEVPGFTDLKYSPQDGFTYEEIQSLGIVPCGLKTLYKSSDRLKGKLEDSVFVSSNSCSLETADHDHDKGVTELFSGQIVSFFVPESLNLGNGYLQIFDRKAATKMKNQTARKKIETGNGMFDKKFLIYTDNIEYSNRILSLKTIEKILEFSETVNDLVYIVFLGNRMFVSCRQFHPPFGTFTDVSVEEQTRQIKKDTYIIRKAKEITSVME